MNRILVTGATGFIGHHLVKQLSQRGCQVVCLVRATSDTNRLREFSPEFVLGDVTDRDSLRRAVAGCETVYHLAGLTKSLQDDELMRVNEGGVRNIASACATQDSPPKLVLLSSLAAAGPSANGRPRMECDDDAPVSNYGRSKLAGEHAAFEFADRVSTTILRSPIVFGEGDRDGLAMFKSIAKWGIHVCPTLSDYDYSVIHAEDLCRAIIALGEKGKRIEPGKRSGLYFVANPEFPSYAELGRTIGRAVGRQRIRIVRIPSPVVRLIGLLNGAVSQIRRKPHILSRDKAREAVAGSWTCSTSSIQLDTGFAPTKSLEQRIKETAQWYIKNGWLRVPRSGRRNVTKRRVPVGQ